MRRLAWLFSIALCTLAATAHAQPSRGDMRFTIDMDLLGIAGVDVEGRGADGDRETSVFTVGNAVAPVSLGLGWALSDRSLLDTRISFGFQKNDPDGGTAVRLTTFSVNPHVTFLPIGDETKLAIELGPILRVQHWEAGSADGTSLAGGLGAALGLIVFASHTASIDVGFFFDATFGELTQDLGWFDTPAERDARILRGGVRLGVSIWE